MTDYRLQGLALWAANELNQPLTQPTVVSGDASFRRYFRVHHAAANQSVILVDSPPDKEPIKPFEMVTSMLSQYDWPVPNIMASDAEQGFMIVQDFGDRLLLARLQEVQKARDLTTASCLYQNAIDLLVKLQRHAQCQPDQIPRYDAALLHQEMKLFIDWFLGEHLQLNVTQVEQTMLVDWFADIQERVLRQPKTVVHRDFHSRNLMILNPQNALGVIDYQDACWGSYVYDLVSLLKDCYIYWPRKHQLSWLDYFVSSANDKGLPLPCEVDVLRDFDLMGLQRHIKVVGIFCRLFYRDNKSGYLKDIPLVLGYIRQALHCFPEYSSIAQWFDSRLTERLVDRSMLWINLD